MKFSQLPIGARFEFEGKVYVKTGPIAAASEDGGQRMIPRYAVLRPLDGTAPPAEAVPGSSRDEAAIRQAFEAFWHECDRALEDAVEDDGRLDEARGRMAKARARFLSVLGISDTEKD